MQIDFSKSEAELMDEALKEWAQAPIRDGMGSSVLGLMLGRATQTDAEAKSAMKREIEEARESALKRERRALLLRAKLAQAMARESEHDTAS